MTVNSRLGDNAEQSVTHIAKYKFTRPELIKILGIKVPPKATVEMAHTQWEDPGWVT